MEMDTDMELFYEYFRKPESEEEGDSLSVANLAGHIKIQTGIAISKKIINKLGRNLKSLNFKFRKSRGITQYEVLLRGSGVDGAVK